MGCEGTGLLFELEEDPVDESPSSVVSTGDKLGDSERDFRDDFSSTLMSLGWTVIVFPVVRSGRD